MSNDTITFVKPSGTEIKVGNTPANIAEAERLGWKRKTLSAPKKQATQEASE